MTVFVKAKGRPRRSLHRSDDLNDAVKHIPDVLQMMHKHLAEAAMGEESRQRNGRHLDTGSDF